MKILPMILCSLQKIKLARSLTDVVKLSAKNKTRIEEIKEINMPSFNEWYHNIADMPEQDEQGRWFDAETGLYFEDFDQKSRKNYFRRQQSEKVLAFRRQAQVFGGKALKGIHKQVAWAEEIRFNKINELTDENEKRAICDPTSVLRHSFVWIANKNKSASDFVDFINRSKILLERYHEAQLMGNKAAMKVVAIEYNELISKFNIK